MQCKLNFKPKGVISVSYKKGETVKINYTNVSNDNKYGM